EAIFSLQRAVDILRAKEEPDSWLNNEIDRGVVADVISGSGVTGRTIDPQIAVTHAGAKNLRPIVCVPDVSRACRRGYQVPVRVEADIRAQAEVVVVVIRDTLSE